MPFVLRACPEHEATSQASEVKEKNSELTFVFFSYKRNGFASFATKRRKITYLTRFILFFISNQQFRKSAKEFMNNPG